jgi:perosamine synthetase
MLAMKIKSDLKEKSMIPVNEPILGQRENELLQSCMATGWISSEGPFVRKFEHEFAGRLKKKHGIAVCNGSAALEVALAGLNLGEGDEVILPTFTIISCAAAVIRTGATPVLVDSDPLSWNMDVSQVEKKITPQTKAIMAVHIYGLPVDMAPLLVLAAKYGLKIIEDTAEMLGQTYNGRTCGSLGDVSTFSFYPNKLLTTGEGGMLLTDSDEVAGRCRSLRNLFFQPDKRFVHEELGWNYRMTNLQAALGLAQLGRLDDFIDKKRQMGRKYTAILSDIPGLDLPLAMTDYAENIYWVYGIVLKDEVPFDAEEVMKCMARRGIATRPFFWPMHEQPVFSRMKLFHGESYPVAERIARRGFYIPSGLALSDQQMEQVARILHEILA